MGLLNAETLVLYGSAFLLPWDRVVVKLRGGEICRGGIAWVGGRCQDYG